MVSPSPNAPWSLRLLELLIKLSKPSLLLVSIRTHLCVHLLSVSFFLKFVASNSLVRSMFLFLPICSICAFKMLQHGQPETWNTSFRLNSPITAHIFLDTLQICSRGAHHPLLHCDLVLYSRHWLPSHFAPQPLAHGPTRNKDQYLLSSQCLRYLMPFWHSDTCLALLPTLSICLSVLHSDICSYWILVTARRPNL